MIDSLGRNITYLRLSLTERCTLRCAYCRAAEGLCPKKKELSAGDLLRIVRVMAGLGIDKVRLTGGEPMLRKDLLDIVSGIRGIPGIREITMTTNAQQLPGMAQKLREAGLNRLNISLDSLKPERYRDMTGGGDVGTVLKGIDEAVAAGLLPLKINVVLLRGVNDDEVDDFIALTHDKPLDVRFIELMPLGEVDRSGQRVSTDELLEKRPDLFPVERRYPSQPSLDYQAPGSLGRVGFISPMSHRFCADCNRVRVMSDGMLRPCLGHNSEVSLRPALAQKEDGALRQILQKAIYEKPAAHAFDQEFHTEKSMSRIGG